MKVSLLSIGDVQLVGLWDGVYGQFFKAWAPLIKRDRSIEAVLVHHSYKHTLVEICSSETLLAALPPALRIAAAALASARTPSPPSFA